MMNEFEKMHWHDNAIHSFQILEGDISGDLVFDIDYIIDWSPTLHNHFNFKIAPSNLIFHEVTDLIISINYAKANACVQPMIIYEIHRQPFTCLNGHNSYHWKIEMNWPTKSFISFDADTFSQHQRMETIISEAQYLTPLERKVYI